ncbi:MAG: hypothetical protein M0C28_08175 [Candidatus Moduliflexus flocculans]|nr:hypothetical protein [Candidatus Moduliflexus flocculans]
MTGEDHFAVLDKVLKAVDGAKHIRPEDLARQGAVVRDRNLAPGADEARRRLR